MVNDFFGESHCWFCRFAGNKTNTTAKELNTQIEASPHRKIGLALNSLFQKATTKGPLPSFLTVFKSFVPHSY